MNILAIDSATSACSAAIQRDGVIIARRLTPMARGQSEALIPMVADVMAEAELNFSDLDLLAVTVGPGAFTGIRIGLSAARALALASGKALAGVATTEAVAAAIPQAQRNGRAILVALDSRREEIWAQCFDADLTPLGDIRALTPQDAARLITGPAVVAGDAAHLVLPFMEGALAASSAGSPDAAVVAALAARKWPLGETLPPEPLYLRPADVTMPSCAP